MKKFIYIILLSGLILNSSYSQLKWRKLVNAPSYSTGRIDDLFFINPNTGWTFDKFSQFPAYISKVSKTTDGGATWNSYEVENFNAQFRCMGFANENVGYIGTIINNGTKIYKTTNGGVNWFPVLSGNSQSNIGVCGIAVITENIVYATGRFNGPAKFLKTTNGGQNWIITEMGQYGINLLIDCKFFNADSGFITGGTDLNASNSKPIVLFTSNGGDTWVQRYIGINSYQWGWKISFPTRSFGYISLERTSLTPKYFLKTTNGGDIWEEKLFIDSSRNEQGIGFINKNTGWIGGYNNYGYMTTNGGDNWNYAGIGYIINRFRIINDTLAYASGDGIYKFSKDSTVNIQHISNDLPDNYKLSQNFPNPFNNFSVIEFAIKNNTSVSIILYNSAGVKMKTLINNFIAAGTYRYNVDASDLASGIYYYQMITESFSDTKKMILIK